MEDFEGNQRYAEYKNFIVDDEKVTLTNFVGMIHEGVHEYAARGSVLQQLWRIPECPADVRRECVLACQRPPLPEASSLLIKHRLCLVWAFSAG